jgi:hypothetical protein
MQVVEVVKKPYTPRNEIQEDRFNVKLKLKALVPRNSYLVNCSMPTTIESDINIYKKLIEITDTFLHNGDISRFIRSVSNALKYKTIKTEFPRYRDTYFIPGSSIKGAVRSRIEYKLKPCKGDGKLKSLSCYIAQNPFVDKRFAKNHIKFWGTDVTLQRQECAGNNVCLVCDLFGNRNLASRVYFSDAKMVKGDVEFLKDLRVQAAKPLSEFELTVTGFNLNFLDLALLMLGFEIFSGSPILLGMYKYRYLENKYKNYFIFGLLKFEIEEFLEIITNKLKGLNIDDLKKIAFEELKKHDKYVDLSKGVIKY